MDSQSFSGAVDGFACTKSQNIGADDLNLMALFKWWSGKIMCALLEIGSKVCAAYYKYKLL